MAQARRGFFRSLTARALADRRGNVAVIFALTLPMVVGGVGFGVETGYWYYQQLRLQQSADAAAYAGAVEQRMGMPYATVLASATAAAQQNGFDPAAGTIVVNTPPASGAFQNASSVEVLMSRNEQRFFSEVFSTDPVVSTARAVATFTNAANACVLTLDPIADRAANFAGNTNINLNGCSVMANSLASDAVNVQGSAQLSTPCVLTAGGVSANGGLTMTSCTSPQTALPPVADPLKDLPEPSDTGQCRPSNGATLQPGRYCNGLNLSGPTNLNPGTYIVSGGQLKINANASISGQGVTIYLTNNASVSINGNATLNLSAPTSGTYAGVLFFGARENTSGAVTLNGTAGSIMTGTIYFPDQDVSYLGNFSGANGCTHVIAKTVQWSGSTTVGVDCSAYGMADLQVALPVKLAE
jgi:Flp pilus assembly protein TadG